jgi:hypothetical protein
MNAKFARLRLAALVGIAWASSPVLAAEPSSTFTLTWTSPTENEDGSPLTDLVGYHVYVGQSRETLLPFWFTISQHIVLSHTMFDARYFAVSAVNTSGVESALTEVVSAPVEIPH